MNLPTALLPLLAACFSVLHATAQDAPFDFSGTPNTSDVALATDKGGRFHTIMVRPGNVSEVLRYYFKDGDAWTQGASITSAGSIGEITGIDLAIDSTSTLHAAYYDRGDVFYATLTPGATAWQVSLIQNGATGTTVDPRFRTTIDIRENSSGITPQVAYTRTGSPDATAFGVYAFLGASGSWTREDITPGGGSMGARFAVISSEPLPSAGLIFAGQRGPAIAYYEDGEYLITQRSVSFGFGGQPPIVGWSTPIVVADGPESTLNSSFFELDFEVSGNVSHLICNGTAPDNTSGLLYNRRAVGFGIGIGGGQQVFSTYENIDRGNTGRREALSLATDSGGTPHVSYVRSGNNRWEFLRARRTTTDTWAINPIFGAPINFAGEPDTSAITIDILGRPAVIATRENGLDTRFVTTSDLPLASSTFTIEGEEDSTNIPGSLAIDALGGAGFAYPSNAGTGVSFRYRSATGVFTTTTLDLGIPSGNTSPTIDDALAAAFGPDQIAVVTQVTSQAPSFGRTVQRKLFLFTEGNLTSSETLTERSGFIITSLPAISVAGDEGALYIASFPANSLVGDAENSPSLYARNLDGSRNFPLEAEFEAEVPGGYIGALLRAEGGSLGVIGRRADALSLHFRLPSGRWESDVAFESANDLPINYDLAFGRGSAIATYADGNTIYVANTVRSVNDPLIGNMPRTRITSTFGGAQLAISYVGADIQVVLRNLGGGDFGRISQYLYRGFPREDQSNQKSLVGTFDSTPGATFAFDRYGFPAILAVEQSPSPATRLLATSALTVDADGDGMPLFQELALCLDPTRADAPDPLSVTKTATGSTIAFDRVPGTATSTIAGIEAGIFKYDIEFSQDLETFRNDNRIVFDRTPAVGSAAEATGIRQEVAFTERFPDTLNFPRYFFRIRIGLR